MATRTRTTTNVNPVTSGLINPIIQTDFPAATSTTDVTSNAPTLAPFDDEPMTSSSNTAAAKSDPANIGEGEQLPAEWIRTSSLVFPFPDNDDAEPTCFFEPLNYCKHGCLINGFCEYHANFMFNVTLMSVGVLQRTTNDKLAHIKQLRKFIRFPTRFQSSLLRIMPVPELCDNIEDFERNLRLDLFAYSLLPKVNSPTDSQYVDLEIAVHKAYLVRALRLFTPNANTQHRNDDAIIAYNVSNWIRYCARELKRVRYDGKLVFLATTDTGSEMRYLSLNKCSVLTQMIALMYDTPYVQSPTLNYKWLSLPAAVTVYDNKNFVLDCTKASHGTATNLGVPTIGDPATLAYFRLDKNDNIYIYEEKYSPSQEVCFKTEVNKGELIGITPDTRSTLLGITMSNNV